jgi:hypothetical protein
MTITSVTCGYLSAEATARLIVASAFLAAITTETVSARRRLMAYARPASIRDLAVEQGLRRAT